MSGIGETRAAGSTDVESGEGVPDAEAGARMLPVLAGVGLVSALVFTLLAVVGWAVTSA